MLRCADFLLYVNFDILDRKKVTKNTVKDLAVWEISTTFAHAIQK